MGRARRVGDETAAKSRAKSVRGGSVASLMERVAAVLGGLLSLGTAGLLATFGTFRMFMVLRQIGSGSRPGPFW